MPSGCPATTALRPVAIPHDLRRPSRSASPGASTARRSRATAPTGNGALSTSPERPLVGSVVRRGRYGPRRAAAATRSALAPRPPFGARVTCDEFDARAAGSHRWTGSSAVSLYTCTAVGEGARVIGRFERGGDELGLPRPAVAAVPASSLDRRCARVAPHSSRRRRRQAPATPIASSVVTPSAARTYRTISDATHATSAMPIALTHPPGYR